MKSDLVDLCVKKHAQTLRAILVSDSDDEKKAVWIPLSQCQFEEKANGIILLTMPEWLAIDKGLV